MKNGILILTIVLIVLGGGILWYLSSKNQSNNYQAEVNKINYEANKNAANINTNTNRNSDIKKDTSVEKPVETEISTFSTVIHNKDHRRQNNISITCKTLSGKEIKPGETFSFCNIVGDSTTAKGYQEAEIYVKGEKKMGLGGGNCQVSTTLYNAVLNIPELEIVERHEHSGHVPYIEKGKDAAVSYGAYDFKFKNNTQNTLRIVMENTADNITAKILKIS